MSWLAFFVVVSAAPVELLRADATEDLDAALEEATAAQNDATTNAPDQATVKGREDGLDRAIRNNEAVQGDPNSTPAQKTAAQAAENTARQQADGARNMARDKAQAGRYRDALRRRRAASKRLQEVMNNLRGMLGGAVNRREIEAMINRARNAKKELDAVVPVTPVSVSNLVSDKKVSVDFAGTGETIGHIADLTVKNLTPETLAVAITPMILESRSGKNQHYACPNEQTVELGPNETKTVPMDGVCLVRNKPPVAKNVTGDLAINDGNPKNPRDPTCKISTNDATKMLRVCTGIYRAAEALLQDGALKEIPYSDPKKKKDVVVQWCTWTNPEISQLTGAPPATKEDLKKVVYKQVQEQGPMSTETKKKVDQGIDAIFEKVELTSAKAKDLEEPKEEGSVDEEGADVDDYSVPVGQPTPRPQTKEKEKEKKPDKSKGTTPKPKEDKKPGGDKTTEKPGEKKPEEKPPPGPAVSDEYPSKAQSAKLEDDCTKNKKKANEELGKATTPADKKKAQAKLNALDKLCHEATYSAAHVKDDKKNAGESYNDAREMMDRLDSIPDARDRLKKAGFSDKEIDEMVDALNESATGGSDPSMGSQTGMPSDKQYGQLAGNGLNKKGYDANSDDGKKANDAGIDLKAVYLGEGKYNKNAK